MEAKLVNHKGKKIISVDFRGAKSEQDIINTAQQGFKVREANPDVVGVLPNFTGVDQIYSEQYVNKLKESVDKFGREKIAIVGITGINKTVGDGVNVFAGANGKLFDNEEEAKDWLVS